MLTSSISNDCVFNVFNYLDGNVYDYDHYYYNKAYQLGYTPGRVA
ncbi:hypothetical protein [Pedobacter ginsenosidimutans]|nr:hypothetical protein [Pedobacter ginsenosidimutans]